MVEHLVAARLLSTDVATDTGERTIEPAHEALLRQWGLLQGWLEEDFAALTTLEGVRRAARDWAANAEDEAWLAHTAGRLEDAEAVARRDDFLGLLEPTDRAYLAAARTADTRAATVNWKRRGNWRRHRSKVAQRTRIGLIAAGRCCLALVPEGAGGAPCVADDHRRGQDLSPRSTTKPLVSRRSLWWRSTKVARPTPSSWRSPPGRVPDAPIVPGCG